MRTKKISLFLLITFAATWISWWFLSVIKQDDTQIFSNPVYFILFFLGGIAPTIAAYLAIKYSDKEFKKFNKSVLKIRVNVWLYVFSILLIIGVRYLAIWIYGLFYEPVWSDLSPQFISLIPLTLIMVPLGGLEELGWRGLLLPELSKKISFQISALVVSIIWAVWHLPMFFIHGLSHYQSDFLVFTIQTIGLGLVLAWLFGRTKSIFLCVLFHAFYNASSSIGLSIPDNGEYITALIYLMIGTGLILFDRKKLNINGG